MAILLDGFEIASLRPVHHAVQGFVRNDTLLNASICNTLALWKSLPASIFPPDQRPSLASGPPGQRPKGGDVSFPL